MILLTYAYRTHLHHLQHPPMVTACVLLFPLLDVILINNIFPIASTIKLWNLLSDSLIELDSTNQFNYIFLHLFPTD